MDKIQLSLEERNGVDLVRYRGPISEESGVHLAPLAGKVGKRCIFNFKDVNFVNSSGVRAWVTFLRDFIVGREIVFEECPPVVVTQINMIPSFTAAARVASVLAPFACGSCNEITLVKMLEAEYPAEGTQLPPGRCRRCSEATQLAETTEEYFEFFYRPSAL